MKPVEPIPHQDAVIIRFAEHQQDLYDVLPASVDPQGTVMTEWELTDDERMLIASGAKLRLWILYTGVARNEPMTPIALEVVP